MDMIFMISTLGLALLLLAIVTFLILGALTFIDITFQTKLIERVERCFFEYEEIN